MFESSCLVFPFHWMEGQAGPCSALSRRHSRFPGKGGVLLCAAYLRSRCGICLALEMSAGPVTAHSATTCMVFINITWWKPSPAFLEVVKCLSIFSPVVLPLACSPLLLGMFITLPGQTNLPSQVAAFANPRATVNFIQLW